MIAQPPQPPQPPWESADLGATREALRDSEARFRAISDVSPLGIFVSDTHGGCIYTNPAYHRISGLSFDQALGTNWATAVHPEDRQLVLESWFRAAQGTEPFKAEFRFLREDGSVVWTRINSAAMLDGLRSRGHVQTVEDITERKHTERVLRLADEALFEEKERAQVTLNSIGDAVLATDLDGRVTYMNQIAETMTGWSCVDALGRPLAEVFRIVDGNTRATAENPALQAIAQNRDVGLSADCVLCNRDGSELAIEDSAAPIHNRDGQVTGAVIVFRDVSHSRALARQMTHLAQHDFLTDLPNRALLSERLFQAMGQARRHRKPLALLFLDLDNFKDINDSLGHIVGDHLLNSVADRLVQSARAGDTVCRQGGDEFVVLLTEIERAEDAGLVAEKLLGAFTAPHPVDGHELHVTLSIGISTYPDDGDSADTLMQNADTALYQAKADGRNNYRFFHAEMKDRAVHRLMIENSLHRALRQDEFLLHYQPRIHLDSGRICGAEALIRWMDPERGLIPPGQFVSIAEACGLIVPIGRWVLGEACRQAQAWRAAGLSLVPVAVNISAVEFRHRDFLAVLAGILRESGLEPCYLELELTESILMQDSEASATVLKALKTMGVRLAIDDFGTGYSSLSYLRRYPIHALKIDQSFVRDIVTNVDDVAIVRAVIGIGRSLKLRVTAEGIETVDQLALLRELKCDEGQGFHFSHPLPAEKFALLLGRQADMPEE